jgi:hypothetical protein
MVDDAKDKFIAPKISRLAAPAVPDISAEWGHLLNAFILNFDLALVLSNKHRQLLFNVIRKADDAFEEYCRAAGSLKDYVTAHGLTLSHYFSAIRHFEHCLAHLYQAVCCMNGLTKTWGGEKQFSRGDGSILERVDTIHNQIKHMDERFEKGDFGDSNSFALFATKSDGTKTIANDDVAGIANVPMWLTDDGLECAKATITFREPAQEIRELCQEAKKLARITPNVKKPTG